MSQSGTPGSSATGARQNASPGRGGRVRDSFEWVFKHGFSSDSSRKSMNQGNNGSVPRILEGKHADEELAYRNLAHYGQSLKFHHGESRQSLSSTPDPLAFALAPAVHDPSLSAVPVRDVYSGKLVRNYEQHPSRNRFFFGGRLLTGGDSPWAFVASSLLVLGITGVWFGTTCVWWWLNESPAVAAVGVYLSLITISSMIVTVSAGGGI